MAGEFHSMCTVDRLCGVDGCGEPERVEHRVCRERTPRENQAIVWGSIHRAFAQVRMAFPVTPENWPAIRALHGFDGAAITDTMSRDNHDGEAANEDAGIDGDGSGGADA